MNLKPCLLAAALWASASAAWSQVRVDNAWVRATVPALRTTGAFMTLASSRPVRLVGASSPAAPTVELHEMTLDGNVMRMRQVAGIDVGADRAVELKPGGFHLMLLGLPRQIKAGDAVPLTLVFEDADRKRLTVEVTAQARALGSGAPHAHGGK